MDSIGRYEIRSVMGSGSFATVYEAFDPRLESIVAVKVLAENWSHQPDVRARFRQEAVLLRRCQTGSPGANLVEVFDIDESADGRPFFVMPLASGGSLETRTQGGTPVDPQYVVPVINMLERSLSTLHRAGIVHRDVKPSNLLVMSSDASTAPRMPGELVGPGERLLLGDLGLAKEMLDDGSALTIAGGTPKFMAPEQRDPAAKLDARADLFGATAVIAELLTGSPDYPDDDIVGAAVGAQLRKGLSEMPGDRHLSASDWGSALRQAIGPDQTTRTAGLVAPTPSRMQPSGVTAPSSGGSKLAALGAAAIVALGLVAFLVLRFLTGSAIGIEGPTTAQVGETIILRADVPEGSDYTWTVGAQEFRNLDLQLTPRSVGSVPIELTAETADGIETATHSVRVEE